MFQTVLIQPIYNLFILLVGVMPHGDAGLAIVALTLLMRAALYPVFTSSIRTQMGMQAMQADAAKRSAELKALADVKPEPIPQFAQPQADSGAKITLGQINQRLSPIALSVAGLTQLGIQPAGKDRAAVLYLESDVARICSALIRHLTTVARGEVKEAA